MGCGCQEGLAATSAESSTPWWVWGLVGVGGFLALGMLKMNAFHTRYGKAAEKKCAHHKTLGPYNACIERELEGKHV